MLAPACKHLPDEVVSRLRDQLYVLAEFAITSSPSASEGEEIEERAAIMEFDGGLTRPEAEGGAVVSLVRRRR